MRSFAIAVLTLFRISIPAGAQPLYTLFDVSSGTLPAAQPWLTYADNGILNGGTATQTAVAGQGVRLFTDVQVAAGYSNYTPVVPALKNAAFPILDRTAGFRLSWTARVSQEAHQIANRAGFSVILLANDRRGIELGFWANEVWAQSDNPPFTQAEGASFNTTQVVTYGLTFQGTAYALTGNGAPLLAGPLRDYSTFGVPYNLPNYLFLGDDTSSASADVTLGPVTLVAPVPEPTALVLTAGAVVAARRMWRRRPARSSFDCPKA